MNRAVFVLLALVASAGAQDPAHRCPPPPPCPPCPPCPARAELDRPMVEAYQRAMRALDGAREAVDADSDIAADTGILRDRGGVQMRPVPQP